MKWLIISGLIVLLLPFYVYMLAKAAQLGKLMAMKQLIEKEVKDEKGSETKKEE